MRGMMSAAVVRPLPLLFRVALSCRSVSVGACGRRKGWLCFDAPAWSHDGKIAEHQAAWRDAEIMAAQTHVGYPHFRMRAKR